MIDPSALDRSVQDRLNRICRLYIRTALASLVLGLLLGAAMILFGNDNLQFVHVHLLLIGFLLFLVYGIGFKLIPTMFFGLPRVAHIGWAEWQFYLAHVGLVGLLLGAMLPVGLGLDRIAVPFAFIEAAAGVIFAVLMTRTIGQGRRRP